MKITNPNHIYPLLISVNVFLSSYLIFKKAVKKFGKLDVLVANAGICIVNPAVETTPDDIDKIFSINFKGTFLTDIAAAKQMIKQDTLVIS
ncbi:SDR family NAD(P)-dependent oxidoreductase [Clostridium tyrobutyricum]|uniref:SDR family NAD(P)-dependent oxidoreductase n=1 Tax=Clostridium tyrobutyricum TaxID=1519 RepID=UPI0009B7F5A9|nr:SDR family oxidoreductase [Clostridium tyrobutyricum]